ncbi:MAG: helix-turn-helix transcriptional regulator [Candidatus Aminicenantes bacterium]|nr:MAG: helix-turn-helix transcriptional regulator [Candidatus Aminicenantes bacterium]
MKKAKKEFLVQLGQRVDEIRKRLNFTQKQMAEILEVSGGYFSSIKRGKYNPTFLFYYNMAKKLHVNLEYLFFGTGNIFKNWNLDQSSDNTPVTISSEHFGQDTGAVKEMIRYMQQSPMTRNTVLGDFRLFLYEKENSIKKDIKKNKKIKNQNKEKKNDTS